jgi:hypothetical protein
VIVNKEFVHFMSFTQPAVAFQSMAITMGEEVSEFQTARGCQFYRICGVARLPA